MGGVLVDQVHAVRTLGDDEAGGDLAQDAQQRHPGRMRRSRHVACSACARRRGTDAGANRGGVNGIGRCRAGAKAGIGSKLILGSSSWARRASAVCTARCTARQAARSSTNFTSALVGWTLTSTAAGSRRRWTAASGCRPTSSREWYASSRAKPSARFCTQRPLTKMTMPWRWERESSGAPIQPVDRACLARRPTRRAVRAGWRPDRPPRPRRRWPRR